MLTFVARRFGESAIEEAFARCSSRTCRSATSRSTCASDRTGHLERNLYLSFEAMRGHLVGPDRTGDMEVDEHDDRYVISFDPCGSGGRAQRGDPIEGTARARSLRMTASASRRRSTTGPGTRRASVTTARTAASRSSTGRRSTGGIRCVIDSPLYPDETSGEPKKCTWTIYKTLEAIPAEAYERIGMKKPS